VACRRVRRTAHGPGSHSRPARRRVASLYTQSETCPVRYRAERRSVALLHSVYCDYSLSGTGVAVLDGESAMVRGRAGSARSSRLRTDEAERPSPRAHLGFNLLAR
jgi:hypothetical protein